MFSLFLRIHRGNKPAEHTFSSATESKRIVFSKEVFSSLTKLINNKGDGKEQTEYKVKAPKVFS